MYTSYLMFDSNILIQIQLFIFWFENNFIKLNIECTYLSYDKKIVTNNIHSIYWIWQIITLVPEVGI